MLRHGRCGQARLIRKGWIFINIGIIGFGNLGRALAEGLVKSGTAQRGGLFICDNNPEALSIAKNSFSAVTSGGAEFVIENSNVIFLTVKGYVFEKITQNIDKGLFSNKIVVSFMAGVKLERLGELIGDAVLVRAMPSLAIAGCDGVIGYTKAPGAVEDIFKKLGYAFETEPEDIEKVMAFSSCGLGFAAYLLDAFSSAGQSIGFTPETCAQIASQTFKNAIGRGGFMETVRAVATPGGATEMGVLHMDACDVRGIIAGAVTKAYDKMK